MKATIPAITLLNFKSLKYRYVIPAQDPLLHNSSSILSPKQWSPNSCGRGLEQDRLRLRIPTPHVAEHFPQLSQVLQPPCTFKIAHNNKLLAFESVNVHVYKHLIASYQVTSNIMYNY